MTSIKSLIAIVLLAVSFSQQAEAYIPPFWFAVRSLAQSRKDLQIVQLKSKVTAGSSTLQLSSIYNFKESTISVAIIDSSGKPTYSQSFSLNPTSGQNHILPIFLFQEQSPILAKALIEFGFPISMPNSQDPVNHENSKLIRESDKIGYLYLGKPERRMILEKDSFFPILLESKGTKILFKNYKLARFIAYPKLIQVFEAGATTPTIQEEISEIQINSPINPLSFKQGIGDGPDSAPDLFNQAIKWLK